MSSDLHTHADHGPPVERLVPGASAPVTRIEPSKGLLDLGLRELWGYRGLLYRLVWRDITVRYKQAAFGAAWAIIQPAFAVAVFTAVFGIFARLPSDGIPYPVFAFAAMLPWSYFAEAMRRASTGLVAESELIRKVYFPRLIIPFAGVAAPLVDFLITLTVVLLLMAWYGIFPSWNIVFLPFFLVVAMGLSLAIGLLLGPVNVRFRDVMHTVPFLIQIWMYASPIVYPLSMVPEQWRTLYSLNPMVGVIEGFRWALLDKASPDWHAIGLSVCVIAAALVVGLVFFRRNERNFADVI